MILHYKVKLSSFLFYSALFLWIINYMLGSSALQYPPVASRIGQFVVILVLILKWLNEKHISIVKMVCAVLIAITSAIVYWTGGYGTIFTGVFLAISAKDIDFKEILKFLLREMLIITCILFLLSQFGVIPDYTYSRDYLGNITMAHSFGFIYYGMPAYIIMTGTIGYCYLRQGKCSYTELFILGILNFLLYQWHASRLAFYVTLLFLLGYIVVYKLKWISFKRKFWLVLATVTPTFLMVLTFALVILYIIGVLDFGKEFFGSLTARLRYAGIALQQYGLHLFGTEIATAGRFSKTYGNAESGIYIDSGYMTILLKYGIVFTIMLLIVYTILLRYLYKKEDKFCFLWFSIILFISAINNFLTTPLFNPIMFMIPKVLLENEFRIKRKSIVLLSKQEIGIYDSSQL